MSALFQGRYDVQQEHPYSIDYSQFQNPTGNQAGNWQQGMQGMLGATTGAAPQAGTAQTYGGANLGQTATYGGAQLNGGQYNASYSQEQHLANQLAAQAQGNGPSLAQVTAQQQAGQNLSNQMAMLGSQRGSSNPALAQQQALQAGSNAQQQAAQQAVMGRTQEELGAQQAQAGLLGNMNQQASGFSQAQAGLQQQAALQSMGALNAQNQAQAGLYQQAGLANQAAQNQTMLANLQAALAQGQINAQQYNAYMQQLQSQNAQQYQGQMAGQQLGINQQLGIGQIAGGGTGNAGQTTGALFQLAGSMASAAAAASDKRVKKDIQDGNQELDSALSNIYNKLIW